MRATLRIYILLSFIGLTNLGFSQTDTTKSVFDKGLDQYKLQKAKHLLYTYDYNGALAAYEELYTENPDNPMVQYRIAQVHYELRDYRAAANFYGKAIAKAPTIEKDARFNYAKALQRVGEFDNAQEQLTLYWNTLKAANKEGEEISDKEMDLTKIVPIPLPTVGGARMSFVNFGKAAEDRANEVIRMNQGLNFAKETVANPYQVTIDNMGVDINSTFDDYGASISADEKTIIFTSRRPDTKGGGTDPNDGKYMEDIYMAEWNEEGGKWNQAEGIKGRLNTEYHDACLSISPDGETIFVYKNFGEGGSGEIYESRLSSSGKWGGPKDLGKLINTSYFESSATITADEQFLYFLSERKGKGAQGMSDIWMAERLSRSEWKEPVNLGPIVNTPFDERMVFIHPEGNILFFASDGHIDKCIGGYDIYMSEKKDGEWQEPVNLGYPINSVDDDVNFVLSYDSKTAYYSGFKEPTIGGRDIFKIDVTEHTVIKDVRERYVSITGKVTDGTTGEAMQISPRITIYDVATNNEIKEFKLKDPNYSVKVERGKKYKIEISASGFKEQTVEIDLTGDGTVPTITQDFTLNR